MQRDSFRYDKNKLQRSISKLSSRIVHTLPPRMRNEVMSDKQIFNRKPWLALEFASPGVISRSKDSKWTPQLRRCSWRCHTNSLGKMKGTNAPCLVCREHDSCTFHHPQHDSHRESSQITEEFWCGLTWGKRCSGALRSPWPQQELNFHNVLR